MKFNFIFYFFFLLIPISGLSQHNLNDEIVKVSLEDYKHKEPVKRKILNLKNAKFITKINPLTYISVALIFVYQNVFSEQISATCTYEVSCSEFTKKSIEKHGLIKGGLIGFHQLSNCIPGIRYEYPDHLISVERF
jgi:putative component of membrane protein insertase Oxa1/YidC/SpoIIIJ protein YidD